MTDLKRWLICLINRTWKCDMGRLCHRCIAVGDSYQHPDRHGCGSLVDRTRYQIFQCCRCGTPTEVIV